MLKIWFRKIKFIPLIVIEKNLTHSNKKTIIDTSLAFGLNLIFKSSKNPIKNKPIPIIITTHKIENKTLTNVIKKLEKLIFVKEKITLLPIHDN